MVEPHGLGPNDPIIDAAVMLADASGVEYLTALDLITSTADTL